MTSKEIYTERGKVKNELILRKKIEKKNSISLFNFRPISLFYEIE